eukprot:10746219-Alexandrium_andersonii.AAC.1
MHDCNVRTCGCVMPIQVWQLNNSLVSHKEAASETRMGGGIPGLASTCFRIMPYAFIVSFTLFAMSHVGSPLAVV